MKIQLRRSYVVVVNGSATFFSTAVGIDISNNRKKQILSRLDFIPVLLFPRTLSSAAVDLGTSNKRRKQILSRLRTYDSEDGCFLHCMIFYSSVAVSKDSFQCCCGSWYFQQAKEADFVNDCGFIPVLQFPRTLSSAAVDLGTSNKRRKQICQDCVLMIQKSENACIYCYLFLQSKKMIAGQIPEFTPQLVDLRFRRMIVYRCSVLGDLIFVGAIFAIHLEEFPILDDQHAFEVFFYFVDFSVEKKPNSADSV
ncbi:hypothetical protein U1Q18_050661 [Sarracenia purpurea var. burkii]